MLDFSFVFDLSFIKQPFFHSYFACTIRFNSPSLCVWHGIKQIYELYLCTSSITESGRFGTQYMETFVQSQSAVFICSHLMQRWSALESCSGEEPPSGLQPGSGRGERSGPWMLWERDATGNNRSSIRLLAAVLISHSRFSFLSP